jgi:hypothetical protein
MNSTLGILDPPLATLAASATRPSHDAVAFRHSGVQGIRTARKRRNLRNAGKGELRSSQTEASAGGGHRRTGSYSMRAQSQSEVMGRLRFASDAVAVSVEAVDVFADDTEVAGGDVRTIQVVVDDGYARPGVVRITPTTTASA